MLVVSFGIWKASCFIQKLGKETSVLTGNHPGYYDQWFNEKKSADGTIPHWQRHLWAEWDKLHVSSRGNEQIIDSVIELGPSYIGGRTRSIWVDPRNDNVVLAAAISGGVWRSENGGTSWTPINDHETSLMASCFTHNPFNPDIVYYGTGEGRANSADVDGNGIYKSTDGGKTFSAIPSTIGLNGFETIWDIKHSLVDSNTIFVGTNSQGMFRTTNGGQTWEKILSTAAQVNNILVLPDNRVIASMHGLQLSASDSGGKPGTFKNVTMPSWPGSGQFRRIQLANCAKFPKVVYALLEGYGFNDPPAAFYKSSDGGRTWKKQNNPGSGAGYQAYCVMLGVSATDSNAVVAGGVSIAQTNNGGVNWASKTVGHSDHHYLANFSTNTGFFLIGNDGGVYKYRFSSASVNANLNTGYKVTQFYAGSYGPTGQVAIGGTQDNGTHVATKMLTSKQFYGADGGYAHIGLQDGKVAYFSTQNEGIRRIRNFNPNTVPGFTDNISYSAFTNDGVNFINAYGMNPADQNQLYYRTNRYLYRSNDGGDLWDPITTIHSGLKAIGISNHTNPVVYTGGSAAQLYRITNAKTAKQGDEYSFNSAFPALITGDFINSIIVHPNDQYTIFISFSNYSKEPRVWKISGLDGTNPVFTNVSGDLPVGLPVNYVAVDPYNPDKNLFAGTDFGLYYSTDSGNTWVKEMRIPNVAIHEIKMRADRKLFAFTHGRGIWYMALKHQDPGTNVKQKVKVQSSVFPNPASNELNIRIAENLNNASLEVYNYTGQSVIKEAILTPEKRINIDSLKPGYYFVRILNGNKESTTRILVRH